MKDRLKEIRKSLNLTLEKFGEKIGMKKSSLSQLESGKNNITESTIKLICSTFNIDEHWFRTGEGNMLNQSSTRSLEEYAKQKNMSDIEKEIVMNYLDLDVETRGKIINMLKKSFSKYADVHNISEAEKSKINAKLDNVDKKNVEMLQVPARGGKYEIELNEETKKGFEEDLNYDDSDDTDLY